MNSKKILPLLIYTGRFKTMKTPKFYMDTAFLKTFESTYRAQFTFQLPLAATD